TRFSRDWSSDVCSSDLADNTTEEFGIKFGASADTNLYRSAANTLKTDDNLIIGLDLNVLNDIYINGVLLALTHLNDIAFTSLSRSEERRVGKECRSYW